MIPGKLVRDGIPALLSAQGRQASFSAATGDECLRRLREKLLEESHEAATASGDQMLSELADVLEVLLSILKLQGLSLPDLIKAADTKRQRVGGFDGRVIMLDDSYSDGADHE